MSTGVLLALTGTREGELVQVLDAPGTGMRVVRRCADVPEVLAAAMAGLGAVAVLSGDLAGVDRTLVARLTTAGVRTVLVAADDDVKRCRGLGARAVVDARSPAVAWAEAVQAAAVMDAVAGGDGSTGAGSAGARPAGPGAPGPGGAGTGVAGRGAARPGAARPDAGGHGEAGPGADAASGRSAGPTRTRTGAARGAPAAADAARAGAAGAAGASTGAPGVRGGARRTRARRRTRGTPAGDVPGAPAPPGVGEVGTGLGADGPEPGGLGTGEAPAGDGDARPGRLVVVWGPPGAPGRTTTAVTLAAELAATGAPCLLVDADTEAPSVAQVLGLLDETAGIAAAARAAANGRLDRDALARACVAVDGFRVLSGLTRADRWRELPPSSLEVVWERARELAAWTVVDTGAGIEGAGAGLEASFGPRRHQATLSALAAADVVVVVGAGEPVGIHRLVTAVHDLADRSVCAPTAVRVVLVNRVRVSAAGPQPERSIHEALVRFAGIEDAVLVPDDRAALDRCVLVGETLVQGAQASPARAAFAELAARLAGTAVTRKQRRRAARARRRGQH